MSEDRYEWMQRAACSPATADEFFKTNLSAAKAICSGCDVVAACKRRAYELESGEFQENDWRLEGLWGGETRPVRTRNRQRSKPMAKTKWKPSTRTKTLLFKQMLEGPQSAT